jgi:hypothetical protein
MEITIYKSPADEIFSITLFDLKLLIFCSRSESKIPYSTSLRADIT